MALTVRRAREALQRVSSLTLLQHAAPAAWQAAGRLPASTRQPLTLKGVFKSQHTALSASLIIPHLPVLSTANACRSDAPVSMLSFPHVKQVSPESTADHKA